MYLEMHPFKIGNMPLCVAWVKVENLGESTKLISTLAPYKNLYIPNSSIILVSHIARSTCLIL